MMDCKKCHSKCKAACCGVTPMPKEIFDRNKEKIVTKPFQILEDMQPDLADDLSIGVGEEKLMVIPMTESLKCCFLNEDYSCNIYEDRPNVCRKFGDESHPFMTCVFQAKDGRERSRQERRALERKTSFSREAMKTLLHQFKIVD